MESFLIKEIDGKFAVNVALGDDRVSRIDSPFDADPAGGALAYVLNICERDVLGDALLQHSHHEVVGQLVLVGEASSGNRLKPGQKGFGRRVGMGAADGGHRLSPRIRSDRPSPRLTFNFEARSAERGSSPDRAGSVHGDASSRQNPAPV